MSAATRTKAARRFEGGTADVVVEVDGRRLTPELFAALQPTWIRLGRFVFPLVVAACTLRLVPGATTTAGVAAVVGMLAIQGARRMAASHALRRAFPDGAECIALGPDALMRNGVRIGWDEVTDAAEIDVPMREDDAVRVIAVRARGTWSVLTPVARFVRGDYDTARAIVNAARGSSVRVVAL